MVYGRFRHILIDQTRWPKAAKVDSNDPRNPLWVAEIEHNDRVVSRFFGRIQNTSQSSRRAAGKMALGFQGFYETENAYDASCEVDCTYS